MKAAFLFPGQASQRVGMGYDLFTQTEIGRNYFEKANVLMDLDLQDIIFNGPEEKLRETRYTQPAIYVVSVILGEYLREHGKQPTVIAGHSLGEYSALTVAGAFDFESGFNLVKLRAQKMYEAGFEKTGTMAAILGMKDEDVIKLCENVSPERNVVPANFNAPGQVVISGTREAVHRAMELAKDAGAMKMVELNVSGAFHSPLMVPAREALAAQLNSTEINDTDIPVYLNVSAEPTMNSKIIRDALLDQLEKPVRWRETIINMVNTGVDHFIEIGPGKVLQGLTKRINRKSETSGIETYEDLKEFCNV